MQLLFSARDDESDHDAGPAGPIFLRYHDYSALVGGSLSRSLQSLGRKSLQAANGGKKEQEEQEERGRRRGPNLIN